MAEHRNWSIFSSEFGKIAYILADIAKQEHCRTRKFLNFEGRITAKVSILLTLILFKRKLNSMSGTQ